MNENQAIQAAIKLLTDEKVKFTKFSRSVYVSEEKRRQFDPDRTPIFGPAIDLSGGR